MPLTGPQLGLLWTIRKSHLVYKGGKSPHWHNPATGRKVRKDTLEALVREGAITVQESNGQPWRATITADGLLLLKKATPPLEEEVRKELGR